MTLNRWELSLNLTFDITEEDIEEKYSGDAEVDFSRRALERVRADLDKLLENSSFAHYHIIGMPRRCYDA